MAGSIAEQASGFDIAPPVGAALCTSGEMLRRDLALARLAASEAMQTAKAGQAFLDPIPHDQIAIVAAATLPPGGFVSQFRYT